MSQTGTARRRDRPGREAPTGADLRATRDMYGQRAWWDALRRLVRVLALLLGDTAAVAIVVAVGVGTGVTDLAESWADLFPLALIVFTLGQAAMGTYGPNRNRRSYDRVVAGVLLACVLLAVPGGFYSALPTSVASYIVFGAAAAVLVSGVRIVAEYGVRKIYGRGIGRHNTLLIAHQDDAWDVLEHIQLADARETHVVGHLSPEPEKDPTAMGGVDLLLRVLEEHDISNVVISAHFDPDRFRDLVRQCLRHGAAVSIVPALLSGIPCRFASRDLLGWPLIEMRVPRLDVIQVGLKRAADILMVLLTAPVTIPCCLLIAAAVKLDSEGPVLFRQARLGVGGSPFMIYKFRSMRPDAEVVLRNDPDLYRRYVANDFKLPEDEDPRVSRLGRFLRKTSLDELPQLWNVLRGDMSIVGPRPIVPDELEQYGDRAQILLGVRPGLTGLWQINGRSTVGYPQRVEYDMRYITRWSLLLDLKILLLTIPAVLRKEGAH